MIYLYKKHKARQAAKKESSSPDDSRPQQVASNDISTPQTEEKQINAEPGTINTAEESGRGANIPVTETKEEKKRRRIYRLKLMISLFPAGFLAAADTTIVATALTTIASHFSKSLLS
jgi:hypothetical protein